MLFAKIDYSEQRDDFEKLWTLLAKNLVKYEILAEKDSDVRNFKAHDTIMKMSKMSFKEKKKVKRIDPDLYEDLKSTYFGIQNVTAIQLLSMEKPEAEDGYYYCHKTFPIFSPNKL